MTDITNELPPEDENKQPHAKEAGDYVDNTYKYLRIHEKLLNYYGFHLEDFTFLERFVKESDEFSLLRAYRLAAENGEVIGIDEPEKGRLFILGAMLGYTLGLDDLKKE